MNENKKYKKVIGGVLIALIVAALIAIIIIYGTNKKTIEYSINSPIDVASAYTKCIKDKEYIKAYDLLSNDSKSQISEEAFEAKYEEIYNSLGVESIEISSVKEDKAENDNAEIVCTTKLNSIYGEISYQNTIKLIKQQDKKYYIDWDYSTIYPELAVTDKIDVKRSDAKRGIIIDRNGILLAGNGYIASVGLVPGWMNEETKADDIAKVASLLGMTSESINKKMSASYVKPDTFVELATISKQNQTTIVGLNEIDGVKIKDISSRVYPLAEKTAHITGYVQKANKEDIEANKTYDEDSLIGRTGLEKVYDERLRGKDGYEINLLNEEGNIKKNILKTEKEDGEDIKLTIDADIQEAVYSTYATDNSANVVMNPKTGEILALVSTPSYDPNKFVIGMTNQEWNELSNNPNNPMYVRYEKSYAPGSSFKPVTGAIALQTETITSDTEYEASGTSWQKDNSWGSYFITTLKTYNGPANLLNALINSDNIFFAKTALKIGSEKMEEQLKNIGFESDLSFEIGLTNSTISTEGKFTSEIQLADSGYGQGQILLNPIHFASIYSSFVNDGSMVMPYLEYKQDSTPSYYKENVFSSETANTIKNDLVQTIENPEGTAYAAKIDGITLAGKTGTAETKSSKGENAKEIGWFNAFVVDPESGNQLLVISMVENVENKGGSIYVVNKVKSVFEKVLGL